MTEFHLMTGFASSEDASSVISHQLKDGNNRLLVCYDLNNCLKNIKLDINEYDEILDVYLIESILYLGKYHRRYFNSDQYIPAHGFLKYLSEFCEGGQGKSQPSFTIHPSFLKRLLDYALNLKERALKEGVWEHYRCIELPFAVNLSWLTRKGVTLDSKKIETIHLRFSFAWQKLLYALDINNINGSEIKDLNAWILGYGFEDYFPAGRDEITVKDLDLLEDMHQIFKIFLRLDKLKRVKSFVDSIRHQRKIYPVYRTMGAVTGRCTSTSPNIMGIPKIFRPVVIPSRPDFGIVECDYSQMEVGVVAALSNDKNLIHDFNTSDVYSKAGELLFGHSSGDSRQKAKIIFLGILYGLSKKTIAKRIGRTEEEASNILAQLLSRYSALSDYLTSLERTGQENGFVKSISGLRRFRRYPERLANYWEKNWFKNFPIQASAATVFKNSIIKIGNKLVQEPFHLLVPLYDSIVFECPLDRLQEITEVVVNCMIQSMKDFFPMLQPKVSINDSEPSCWNSKGKIMELEHFLNDPLCGIDIREKPSSNVDWSIYL